MKTCELCNSIANVYCESDQACLCWECDARVHTANFIVARHLRILLCHGCQSLTPWTASGRKFSSTVSFCDACVNRQHNVVISGDHRDNGLQNNAEDEEDNGDNQVVPLSITPLPLSMASSGSEESSSRYYSGRDGSSSTSNIRFFR